MGQKQRVFSLFLLSPSSRRAWIEIRWTQKNRSCGEVALLAEGVDRNSFTSSFFSSGFGVALLAEGVDRNRIMSKGIGEKYRRPPRGGRG